MSLSAVNGSFSYSSSSAIPPWKYHVFLSFRGEDTRRGFTDHLYAALQRQGMITFRDEETLERGELISQTLLKAIEDSLSAIVILSQNYASSSWCLDELQKILESKKTLGRDVFPIFYGVDPSEARHQRGRFGEAFKKHEERYKEDKEKVQRWREAMKEIANLSGWNCNNQPEAMIIENIIEYVWAELCPKLPSYNDHFVGIDSMIGKINLLSQDVRFIGIWGMGGTGKTTLARVIYERFRANFEIDCFLHNVTEVSKRSGLVHLQQKLLSHRKLGKFHIDDIYEGKNIISSILRQRRVILVLDDVSDRSHIENLAGNRVWFGQGSTVIITSRDLHLLEAHGIHETYKIDCLNDTESLQLFCQKSFGSDQPREGYLELSKIAVQYTGGLPLALSVLGSFLCRRSLSEWKEALDEMKHFPRDDILKTLKISYDGLEDAEKIIFLDIACFFKGMKKDDVTKILKNCGLNATIGIEVLIEKSLLTSNGWTLEMHDLLQKMGKKIVSQQFLNDIGRQSRLWSIKDINHVLSNKKGTRFNHGIVLESLQESYEIYSDPEAFTKMCNLKLLMISNVHLPSGLTYLPNSLKVLAWDGYPLESLPLDKQDKLVDLKLRHSKIIQPWNESQLFRKLKSIDLCHSKDLTQTPTVSGVPHLEHLILEGCTNLVEVHQSVGQHKKLVELNLKNCINLKIFPSKLEMSSLKDFILSGCSKIEKLPKFGENMKCLVMLDLKNCENLVCLPSTIHNLKSLEILNISGCSKLSRRPNNLEEEEPLEELDVSGTAVRDITFFNHVPIMDMIFTTISHLPLLKALDLSYCNLSDGSIPYDLSGFSSLGSLSLEGNNFSYLPHNFVVNLSKLRFLKLSDCTRLQKLPIVPQGLNSLTAQGCPSLEPVFDPLQLWNFLALDDNKMESSGLPRSTITGNEIPPWFEYQNYVSLDRNFAHMGLDSIVSIKVNIPHHYRLSEWWRIDLCLVLEYVTSNPLENSLASIYWTVLASEPGFPAYRDFVHILSNSFHTSHLYITSLRGLQEQLRGDSDQLEIRIFTKTYESDKMLIRKCGCHVYCKDDVEVWHRTKAYIDYSPSTSTFTSTTTSDSSIPSSLGIPLSNPQNSRDTSLQPPLQMSQEHTLDNEKKNIDDNDVKRQGPIASISDVQGKDNVSVDAMTSRDTPLQRPLQMSHDHILDHEKNRSDNAMERMDTTIQPLLQMSKDITVDNEKKNIDDNDVKRQTPITSISDVQRKDDVSADAMTSRDTPLQPQLQMSKDHIMGNERENIYSNSSMRVTRRFIENPWTSGNSKSHNAWRISNPIQIHPTTNHENLQKFPMRCDDAIYPSSSMHNSSMNEASKLIRFHNKTCMCERRAALKVSHAGKSYYVCDDNKCNYIELSCSEDTVFTSKYQVVEASAELRISLLTNFILSLCVFTFLFLNLFFGK